MSNAKMNSRNEFKIVGKLGFSDDKLFTEKKSKNGNVLIQNINFSIKSGGSIFYLSKTAFKPINNAATIKYFIDGGSGAKTIAFGNRDKIDLGDKKLAPFFHSGIKVFDKDGELQGRRYFHDSDFIEALSKNLKTDVFAERLVEVEGDIEYRTYVSETGDLKTFTSYTVRNITEVPSDKKQEAIANMNLLLGDNALVRYDDVAILEGYVVQEDNYGKYVMSESIEIGLGGEPDLAYDMLKQSERYLGTDERMTKIGMYVKMIDGTERVEFTEDMLTDNEKQLIALGIDTFENIKEAKGDGVGERTRKRVRIKEKKGYGDGAKLTSFSLEDLCFGAVGYEETKEEEEIDLLSFGTTESDEGKVDADVDALPFF